LDVSGTANVNGNLSVTGRTNFTGNVDVTGNTNVNGNLYVTGNAILNANTIITGNLFVNGVRITGGIASQWIYTNAVNNSGNIYYMGNVGIGTSNPQYNLDVSGSANVNGNLSVTGRTNFTGNVDVTGNTNVNGNLYVTGNAILNANTIITGNLFVNGVRITGGIASQWIYTNAVNNSGNIYYMGNVGIGTSNPLYPLDVSGNVRISNILQVGNTIQIGPHLTINEGGGIPPGKFNLFIGTATTQNQTGSQYNTGIGARALTVNQNGYSNTAVGFYALGSNTSGSSNTAVGNAALGSNNTGINNTAVGNVALGSNTSGSYNTAVGYNSAGAINSGSYNTAIGYNTASLITTGINNTAIGFGASITSVGAIQSTVIGANASTSLSNQIVLGTSAESVSIPGRASSSNINTGALQLSGGAGILGNINVGGNVTIGSQSFGINPQGNILTVNGGAGIGANLYVGQNIYIGAFKVPTTAPASSQWTNGITSGNIFFQGNVGIGKGDPQYTLDVSGNVYVNGVLFATNFTSVSDYRIKRDVKPLNSSYNIDLLNPIHYVNTISNKEDMGFFAHELQEIYPYLVDGEKDGSRTQSINYTGLIAVLVKEIQTLKKRVSDLERR